MDDVGVKKTRSLKKCSLSFFEQLVFAFVRLGNKNGEEAKTLKSLFNCGCEVGKKLSKPLMEECDRDFTIEIEKIKFLCKEFWLHVFGKSADKLQTNNSGTYIVTDKEFPIFNKIKAKGLRIKYMTFFEGLVSGALKTLHFPATCSSQLLDSGDKEFVVFNIVLDK